MKTVTMLCLLVGALPAAQAETLVVNDEVVVADSSVPRPNKGQTMTAVEAKFGAPQTRHAAVGKPPITRWDYMNFVVFFEHDRVIHSVALAP